MKLEAIFYIDVASLFPVLFWGNLISLLFLIVYQSGTKFAKDRWLSIFLMLARLCHAVYYFVATGRGVIPDIISVNIGNTLLYVGFFFEAQAILKIIRENSKITTRILQATLVLFAVAFNVVEYFAPYGGIRIMMASLGVVSLMAPAIVRMLIAHDSAVHTKPAAIFNAIFLVLLLGRAWYGVRHLDTGILATNPLHSLAFLASLLQLIISLPSYALIIKDYSDDALLLMATTDRLTGATNRHAFLDAAKAVCKNSRLFSIPVSVVFLDIDMFKQINDTYGHAFGDMVLLRIAELIDKCIRDVDLSCRYGGDEFVMMLPHTDSEAARNVAQRVLEGARQLKFDKKPDFNVTVSVGVYSLVPSTDESLEHAINAADDAMYEAKRAGRNQIVVSELAVKDA